MEHTPEILAYAAGLFDGEGCVQITKPYSKKNSRRYHRLDVSLAQKDPRPIVWMLKHFGGRLQMHRGGIHKIRLYDWVLHNKEAGEFLAAIRPYLILKGEQADIAIAFRATVSPATIGNIRVRGTKHIGAWQHPSPIDNEIDAKRDKLRDELSRLKVVK